MTEIRKNSIALVFPRGMLLDLGAVEPTPDEAEQIRGNRAAWAKLKRDAQPRIRAALAALDSITDPTARAILDLHARESDTAYTECRGCDFGGYEGDPPVWPCRTVELIATRHDIDLSDFYLYQPTEERP